MTTVWLDMDQAGAYCHLSADTVTRATKATDPVQHLEFRQVKGKRLTRPEWVDDWIQRQHDAA